MCMATVLRSNLSYILSGELDGDVCTFVSSCLATKANITGYWRVWLTGK